MKFDDETIDVLIGGYLSTDAAHDDYEAVLASGGYLHGAVVVSKDLQGNLSVEQTDHMVREGAAGLGAVGFAVGLFAPPLLAATAVGAVIGAGAGKLLHSRTASKLEEHLKAAIFFAAGTCQRSGRLRHGALAGSPGPLVLRALMKRPVDPVTEGVGGLVCECLFQIPQDDAHQEVLLPRFRSEAADR